MMKILHLTFDMAIGGTEQVICQLIEGADRALFDQQICCIDGQVGALGQKLQQQGILVQAIARQPGFDWSLVRQIRQLLKNSKIDILHCHQYSPWIYGWLAAFGTPTKVIFTEHGRFFPDRYRRKAWLVNKIMAASTSHITAISAATKKALAQFEFIPETKIQVVYNGIQAISAADTVKAQLKNQLQIAEGSLVIGTVARLDPIKNQPMILKAFAQLRVQLPTLRLLIVGDGPERAMLQQLAISLQLEDSVIFAGFQSPATDYMALMDVFLLPSLSEGTSMTLLEAMSLGIPCVVSDVGGNAEVIQSGKNGIVMHENTESALVAAVLEYASDEPRRIAAAAHAKQRFNDAFSAAQMCRQYADLYLSCRCE